MLSRSFITQNIHNGPLSSFDLNLSKEEKLFRHFLNYSLTDLIEDYNYMIDNIIPGILKRSFVLSDGKIITIKDISIKLPQIYSSNKDTVSNIVTPRICRNTLSTYQCDIIIYYTKNDSNQHHEMKIGSIHCMVGSNRCYTSHKPDEIKTLDEWKTFLGECPSTVPGYFINKGGEKFVVSNELLRTNNYIVFMQGKKPGIMTILYTCLNNSKTTIVQLQIGKHIPTVKVILPYLNNGKHYPLYLVFYLLYYYHSLKYGIDTFNIDYFELMISFFVDKEYKHRVISYLQSSKVKFMNKFYIEEGNVKKVSHSSIESYCKKKLVKSDSYLSQNATSLLNINKLAEDVYNNLFINVDTVNKKLCNLCFMASRLILCKLGLRDLSSRDAWSEKKIDTSTRKITQYVTSTLIEAIERMKPQTDNLSLGKGENNDVIVEARKCSTINESYGEACKTSISVDPRAPSQSIREVSQGQVLFICPVKTPEGEKCGLTKQKSSLLHISLNREYEINRKLSINDLFKQYIFYYSKNQDTEFYYLLKFGNHFIYINDTKNGNNYYCYFSTRILVEISKYYKYIIIDNIINVIVNDSDLIDNNLYTYYNNTEYLVCRIPNLLYQYFNEKVNTYVYNEDFKQYSNTYKTDVCKYNLVINNIQTSIFISDLYIEYIKSKGIDYSFYSDTHLLLNFNSDNVVSIKHWTSTNIGNFNIPQDKTKIILNSLSIINEYMSVRSHDEYKYNFSFNGEIYISPYNNSFNYTDLLFNGDKLTQYLKRCRKDGLIAFDCCIYKNVSDKLVQYNDDSGRVMAPLLIVDDDGQLIIDKNNSWDKFNNIDFNNSKELIESLYKDGSIELIDAKELDNILISENPNECRRFHKLRLFLEELLESNEINTFYQLDENTLLDDRLPNITIKGHNFSVKFISKDNKYSPYYTVNYNFYGEYDKEVYEIRRPERKAYKLDIDYMLFFKDNKWNYIYEDDNYEFDGTNIYIDDQEYKVHYLFFNKKTEYVLKDKDFNDLDLKMFERNKNINVIYKSKNGYCSKSSLEDKLFHKIEDGSYEIVDVIKFTSDKKVAYFYKESRTIDLPIDFDITPFMLNDDTYNERKCNLYVANIRRNQTELDDLNYDKLKKLVPDLYNKNNIKNLIKYLKTTFKFTHSIIDPNQCFSLLATMVPKADSNPGPRHTYHSSMSTQALGVNNSLWYTRFETTHKRLFAPRQSLFETSSYLPLKSNVMPISQNLVVCVLAHRLGFEDPVILSKSAYYRFGQYDREISMEFIEDNKNGERIQFPVDKNSNIKTDKKYSNIDQNGLPILGSYIKRGDCILGKMKTVQGKLVDVSHFSDYGVEGIVSDVKINCSEGVSNTFKIIVIKLKQYRRQQPGDKMTARCSQKGTIGDIIDDIITEGDFDKLKIVDDYKMPYVLCGPNAGMRPDLIFNPASFPSRMTCSLIKEILTSKAGYFIQEKINASNFYNLDVNYYCDKLFENGMDYNGNEIMCHSDGEIMFDKTSNKPFQAFFGIVSYQYLKHHSIDKNNIRYNGAVSEITHQPVKGKKKGGGQRLGEMEKDSFLSGGACNILDERLRDSSDGYTDLYCAKCNRNSSMSNLETMICSYCGEHNTLVRVNTTTAHNVYTTKMLAAYVDIQEYVTPVDEYEEYKYNQQIKNL